MYRFVIFVVLCGVPLSQQACAKSSPTTASGTFAPSGEICSGDLIFQDEFDSLNFRKWRHEKTLGGGGNWEFQWYTNNRSNSFVCDGVLYIKPTLTADHLGSNAIYSQTLNLEGGAPADQCTNPSDYGCMRTGTAQNVLNPVKSASLRTVESFSFKYGRVEVRARLPEGNWLWPAIWMMPRYNAYGEWPTSGEIDIMESRGNNVLTLNGKEIGNKMVGSTLHWGPDYSRNRYERTHWEKTNTAGFNTAFHLYEMVWSTTGIYFYIDGQLTGSVTPPSGGFWELGALASTNVQNPWKSCGVGGLMAPFDQEFYLILNNAVGGVAYFPDDAYSPNGKPWKNNSPKASTDFWENRNMWLDSWALSKNNNAALQVDYVRVYAL